MQFWKEGIGKSALSMIILIHCVKMFMFFMNFMNLSQNRTFWEWFLYISIQFYLFIYLLIVI